MNTNKILVINGIIVLLFISVLFPIRSWAGVAFHEGWETAPIGTYMPGELPSSPGGMSGNPFDLPVISADEGIWFIGDTVSNFSDCGPTPHRAEIISQGSGQALCLTSNYSDCADNVWVVLFEVIPPEPFNLEPINEGFSVPITPDTLISFKQTGALSDPQQHGWGRNCLVPPCFDNISLQLVDDRENILTYVLHRPADAEADISNVNFDGNYKEIFLDPDDAEIYTRNLFDDFSTIPKFNPGSAKVLSLELSVDRHGWAIFDDIAIGTDIATGRPSPAQSPVLDIQANGSEELVVINHHENLSIKVALTANDSINKNADWWLVADTSFGWYYYVYQSATWAYAGNSLANHPPTYQGPLFDLTSYEVLNLSGLPTGTYSFYFGIDMDMNGMLDLDSLYFKAVVANISE